MKKLILALIAAFVVAGCGDDDAAPAKKTDGKTTQPAPKDGC